MAPPEAEKLYPSQNGQTILKVQGHTATICTPDWQEMETLSLRGECMAAAISNHRQWVAAALDKMFTDISLFKKEGAGWTVSSLKRMPVLVESLTWVEAEDPRHPPIELIVTMRGGRQERLLPT